MLFAFGICCLTLSISMTGYLADGRGGLGFPFRWAIFTPAASPAASPTPAAVAIAEPHADPLPSPVVVKRRKSFLGEGPITLRGDGNVALGLSHTSTFDFTQDVSSLGSQMTFDIERRTERSSVHLSQSVGYSPGSTVVGQIQAAYTTPQYELGYGPVAGPGETQLSIGGFVKGIGVTIPRRGGELSLMGATAMQQDGSALRVLGLRRDTSTTNGTFTYSAFYGTGEHNPDRELILDVANRRYGPRLSTFTEFALSSAHNIAGIANGIRPAFALQADLTGRSGFTSLTLHAAPSGFATLTSVTAPSVDADLTMRRDFRGTSANLDLAEDDTRVEAGTSRTRRLTATVTRSLSFGTATLIANLATNSVGGVTSINRSAGVQLSQNIRGFGLSESAQFSGVSGGAGSAVQRQFDFGVTRSVLGGSLSLVGTQTSASGEGSNTVDSTAGIRYTRTIGRKLDLTFAQTREVTDNGGILTRQSSASLGLLRRLSSVVSVHVAGTRTLQTGVAGGASNSLSLDIVGPLGFGESHYTGRSNPNVPATIRGAVTFAASTQDYGATTTRGFGNVLVVLDGRYSQRTDARGEFEFRFVPQGSHTIALEPGSLSPGVIADHQSETVNIMGGQTLTLAFRVGNFAGIGGRLIVLRDGKEEPLGGVGLIIDKQQRIVTAPDGRYQIGRLTPGPHTVAIAMETVPSTVQFTKSEESVVVSNGSVTKADFQGAPLGSIGGMVLYAPEAGFADLHGAKNVYVVAQPGDHAAITNEDGSFLLDNLLPGSYRLEIDPDTLPDGQAIVQQPESPLVLAPGASLSGMIFKLGTPAKNVVFTYSDGKRSPINVNVDPVSAPPGALVDVVARTNAKGLKMLYVESDVFGNFPLRFNTALDAFSGAFTVPALQKGTYALTVSSHNGTTADGDAVLSVDPSLKLVTVRMVPAHPTPGHAVHVIAKVLAPIEEGDVLTFEDGFTVKLPAPQRRVVSFDARIWGRGVPYPGQIVTRSGMHLPLILR